MARLHHALRRAWSPRSRPWFLAAITIGAVGLILRLMFLRTGVPGLAMVNPDEGTVVPLSAKLISSGSLNPEWFLYPSGYFMTLAGLLTISRPFITTEPNVPFAGSLDLAADPVPYLMAGRGISVIAGMVVVIGTFLIAREFCGGRWALLPTALMAVSPLAIEYSHYAVTDMAMTAMLTMAIWRAIVATHTGRLSHIVLAAFVLGVAISYKYNAGLFLIPLFIWLAVRPRTAIRERLVALGSAAVAATVGFLLLTPYALLDFSTFSDDLARQNQIQKDGWLGFESTGSGFIYNITPNLTTALGAACLVLALVGMIVGIRSRRADHLLLWPYVIGTYVYISRWNANFDRYLFPILPLIAVAAGLGARQVWNALPERRRTPILAALGVVLVLVQPVTGAAVELHRLSLPEYRTRALPAIYALIPQGDRIAHDFLTPPIMRLGTARRLERLTGTSYPHYWLFRLHGPLPGGVEFKWRDLCKLKERRIQWIMTSDDIERRARAAGNRYPKSVRFYDDVREHATLALDIPEGVGPGAKVWKMPDQLDCPGPSRVAPTRTRPLNSPPASA